MEQKQSPKKPQMILLTVLSIIIIFGFLTGVAEMYRGHKPRHVVVHTSPNHGMQQGKTASEIPPKGEFMIAGYHAGENKIREDLSGNGWSVTFGDDMKLVGKICNRFSGAFTFSKGMVKAEQVISTKMACVDGNIMEMEQVFLSGLSHGFTMFENMDGTIHVEDVQTKAWFELIPSKK